MSWFKNPFKKDDATATAEGAEKAPAGLPQLPPELANDPKAKGMMAMFYRKWKDPAFLKQLRTLAAHMQKDGVDMKDMKSVQGWLEKNKEAIEKGQLGELPDGAKQEMIVKTGPDVGRNDPCHCGSGKKFKKCCASKS
jgi:preprotein translocase subunit SecA